MTIIFNLPPDIQTERKKKPFNQIDMEDYSMYRLSNPEAFDINALDLEDLKYCMKIYNFVEFKMNPGDIITIKAEKEKIPLIIKTLCLFICTHPLGWQYEFNNSFSRFRRMRNVLPQRKIKSTWYVTSKPK